MKPASTQCARFRGLLEQREIAFLDRFGIVGRTKTHAKISNSCEGDVQFRLDASSSTAGFCLKVAHSGPKMWTAMSNEARIAGALTRLSFYGHSKVSRSTVLRPRPLMPFMAMIFDARLSGATSALPTAMYLERGMWTAHDVIARFIQTKPKAVPNLIRTLAAQVVAFCGWFQAMLGRCAEHRDLKLNNVVVIEAPPTIVRDEASGACFATGNLYALVIDFGIAHVPWIDRDEDDDPACALLRTVLGLQPRHIGVRQFGRDIITFCTCISWFLRPLPAPFAGIKADVDQFIRRAIGADEAPTRIALLCDFTTYTPCVFADPLETGTDMLAYNFGPFSHTTGERDLMLMASALDTEEKRKLMVKLMEGDVCSDRERGPGVAARLRKWDEERSRPPTVRVPVRGGYRTPSEFLLDPFFEPIRLERERATTHVVIPAEESVPCLRAKVERILRGEDVSEAPFLLTDDEIILAHRAEASLAVARKRKMARAERPPLRNGMLRLAAELAHADVSACAPEIRAMHASFVERNMLDERLEEVQKRSRS